MILDFIKTWFKSLTDAEQAMPSMVVIPGRSTRRVQAEEVHSILCNRMHNKEEQYLVRWKTNTSTSKPPLSWHGLSDLSQCIEHLQDYIDTREKVLGAAASLLHPARKRKSPDSESDNERRFSPAGRRFSSAGRRFSPTERLHSPADYRSDRSSQTPSDLRSLSVASSTVSTQSSASIDIYNGVLEFKGGFIVAVGASRLDIPEINIKNVPTPTMANAARRASTEHASLVIRAAYTRKLERVPGSKIHLVNTYDSSTPSLRFQYITDYVLGEGITRLSPDAQVGCTTCSPHMGRDIGCEYTKKCDCLEYAAVDESRITSSEDKAAYKLALATGGSTIGFPKKFPYFAEGTKIQRAGCLVPFYLHSRHPIYECNDRCKCGPRCRNKNVQFGRTLELEIFKTASSRGWGLRCKQKVYAGQFIDTYRGEVITDAEATRREESATSKAKASYLYSLDKFAESESLAPEMLYVVDGEFMGGASKFINHSCEPNCRQYTVSYNKFDAKVYDLAFFACRDIEKGEELTFDYLDKEEDDDDEMDDPGEDAIPCLCGAKKCRKWLWT